MQNNFEIIVQEQEAVITANFEEVKAALIQEVDQYRGLQFTTEQTAQARSTVAKLRAAVKAIETKRKEVKKSHMIPYEMFESQAKELVGIINSAIEPIDAQIKEADEIRKEAKRKEIENYFELASNGNQFMSISEVWSDKWLATNCTKKTYKAAIDEYVKKIEDEVESILATNSEVEEDMLTEYVKTRSLAAAININTKHVEMKRRILEQEAARRKKEEEEEARRIEEARRREEEERIIRIREEERAKIEAEFKAKEATKQQIDEDTRQVQQNVTDSFEAFAEPVDFLSELKNEPAVEVVDDLPFSEEPSTFDEAFEPFAEAQDNSLDYYFEGVCDVVNNHVGAICTDRQIKNIAEDICKLFGIL